MNQLYLLLILILLTGCPVYDPPSGTVTINNKSDSPIYVYLTCNDSLSTEQPLKVYFPKAVNSEKSISNNEQKNYPSPGIPIIKPQTRIDSILANAIDRRPEYLINAKNKGSLYIGGSPEKPRIDCKNEIATIFFITEKTLQHNTWNEICKNGLYEQKIKVNNEDLRSLNWQITFNPN